MSGSNFPFVKKPVLRQNLDEAFEHIVTLLPFTESTTYNDVAKSSFRKTIIIYTASIIEALLFHIVDTELSEDDLTVTSWSLINKKTLHEVDAVHHVVAGDYKAKGSSINNLTVSLPYLLDLRLFFNLKIFTVTRLRLSFCSIRKAGSQANLKPNPIKLLMDEP